MKIILFLPGAFKDYVDWSKNNKELFDKINELLKEIQREPFKGKGKPEPLKNKYKGSWSRRITIEHRLVYSIKDETITIITCHGHYE